MGTSSQNSMRKIVCSMADDAEARTTAIQEHLLQVGLL